MQGCQYFWQQLHIHTYIVAVLQKPGTPTRQWHPMYSDTESYLISIHLVSPFHMSSGYMGQHVLCRAFSWVFNPIFFRFFHLFYFPSFHKQSHACMHVRPVALSAECHEGAAIASFACARHFLFKYHAINQPMPHVGSSPFSP